MKATLQKTELLLHRKHLQILKLQKKMAKKAEVTLTVSEKFVVTGPGFSETLECKAIKWGSARVPFRLWAHLIENLVPASKFKEITISVGHREFHYGEMKIMNSAVCVSGPDKSSVEVPADATAMDIIIFAMSGEVGIRKNSVLEKRLEDALNSARREIKTAYYPLRKYGVTVEDLVSLVAERISFDDKEGLFGVLFGPRRW
mgnify:CR=1 FL=1